MGEVRAMRVGAGWGWELGRIDVRRLLNIAVLAPSEF